MVISHNGNIGAKSVTATALAGWDAGSVTCVIIGASCVAIYCIIANSQAARVDLRHM